MIAVARTKTGGRKFLVDVDQRRGGTMVVHFFAALADNPRLLVGRPPTSRLTSGSLRSEG
jgi:hypothetical protein